MYIYYVYLLWYILSHNFYSLTDPNIPSCGVEVKVKQETFVKSGVAFSKLVVDGAEPIKIAFSLRPSFVIKKIKWHLNGGPIDVDQDETKSAAYWVRETDFVQLVIRTPSKPHYKFFTSTFCPFSHNFPLLPLRTTLHRRMGNESNFRSR